MRLITAALMAVLGVTLFGCADSGHHRQYDINITNHGDGLVYLDVTLDADVASEATSGAAEATATPSTAIGLQGGTGTLATGGSEVFLEAVKSAYEAWQDKRDQSTTETTENTTAPTTPVVTPPVVVPIDSSSDNPDFKFMQMIAWGGKDPDPEHDRKWWGKVAEEPPAIPWQYKWIIPMSLDELGKEILVKFSDGDELWVNNTSGITMTTDHKKFRYEGASHVTKNPIVIGARGKKYDWIRVYYNGR